MSLTQTTKESSTPPRTSFSELQKLLGSRARPETAWIADLTGVSPTVAGKFLSEMNGNLGVEQTIDSKLRETGRRYYAQFPAPLELYAITRILKPESVVESGVSSGISSAHFLMALKKNRKGTLHSIDYPTYGSKLKRAKSDISWTIPYGKDSGWAIPANLRHKWKLYKGKSEDRLRPLLKKIGAVDLYCHDSPWTSQHLQYELDTVRPHLRSGSIVVADNSAWNPAAVERLARSFNTRVVHRRGSDLIGIRVP